MNADPALQFLNSFANLPEGFHARVAPTALAGSRLIGVSPDAARLLGWGRNTLTRKIKELGLEEDHREAG